MNITPLETIEGESVGLSGSTHYAIKAIQTLHEKYGLPYQATSLEMLMREAGEVGIHAVCLINNVWLFGYPSDESMFFDMREVTKSSVVHKAYIIKGKC